jgi:hypothetical protein
MNTSYTIGRSPFGPYRAFVGLAVALHSPLALASDPTGMVTGLALLFFVAPWTVVSALAFLAMGMGGSYRDRERAVRHTRIGIVGPAIGAAIGILEYMGSGGCCHAFKFTDLLLVLAIMAAAAGITALPWWIHCGYRRGS